MTSREAFEAHWASKTVHIPGPDGSAWVTWQAAYEAGRTAEREECAKVCDSISQDQWSLYKGRPPYTGQELERASDYTQGKSAGADVCAAAIRARAMP